MRRSKGFEAINRGYFEFYVWKTKSDDMKIIIVGVSGKIGSKVVDAMSERHDIVQVGAHNGAVQCDYTDK